MFLGQAQGLHEAAERCVEGFRQGDYAGPIGWGATCNACKCRKSSWAVGCFKTRRDGDGMGIALSHADVPRGYRRGPPSR